jgi:ABC-type phosphate transport system auxiliary subunit
LCDVARGQDPNNEDRPKRQAIIEHTREQLDANEKITGWGTLASIIGYDVVERVRALVERAPAITDEQLRSYAKQLKRSKLDRKQKELASALDEAAKPLSVSASAPSSRSLLLFAWPQT